MQKKDDDEDDDDDEGGDDKDGSGKGEGEEGECEEKKAEKEPKQPSIGDYLMHFISLFWKLLFAFVPPTGKFSKKELFLICEIRFIIDHKTKITSVDGLVLQCQLL